MQKIVKINQILKSWVQVLKFGMWKENLKNQYDEHTLIGWKNQILN